VVPAGEASKSLDVLAALYDWALGLRPDRHTPLLALGGGVVGDLAGLAAATLLRGLPLVHLPTTVIAQVDSAIGGKTGINHAAGKNLIGAFHAPRLVLADPATLATPSSPARTPPPTSKRTGRTSSPGIPPHSPRRSAGPSPSRRPWSRPTLTRRARAPCSTSATRSGPPSSAPRGTGGSRTARRLPSAVPADALVAAMGTDKKRAGGGLRFVVLDAPGRPRVTADVPPGAVEAAWAFARLR
jgi:3-dehydroquinate synthetase